jgi:CRISPR-associated protein Cas5t
MDDSSSVLTLTRPDLPRVRLALGAIRLPVFQTLYQQLHNYPVGQSGKERESEGWGSKFNIQPVRREYLADIEGYVVLDGSPSLETDARMGLRGGRPQRYGLPFLGDNNFLLDVLREEPRPRAAHWYERVTPDAPPSDVLPSRLTLWIDRANSSRSRSALYRPTAAQLEIPVGAWTEIPPA